MEKRRRERINHSLETLRLLLLENTDDEVKEERNNKNKSGLCVIRLQTVNYERVGRVTDVLHIFLIIIIIIRT